MSSEQKAQAKLAFLTGSLKDKAELLKFFSDEEVDDTLKNIAQMREQYTYSDGTKIILPGNREIACTGAYLFNIALVLNRVSDDRAKEYLDFIVENTRPDYYVAFLEKIASFPKTRKIFAKILSEKMMDTVFFAYAPYFQKAKLFSEHEQLFMTKVRQSSFSHLKSMLLKVDALVRKDERLEFYTKICHLLAERMSHVATAELVAWLKSKSFVDYASRSNGEYKVDDLLYEVIKIELDNRQSKVSEDEGKAIKALILRKDKKISLRESLNLAAQIIKKS